MPTLANKVYTLQTNAAAVLAICSKPIFSVYCLSWLLVLVSIGTVAQKYIGLFAAQQLYFASFIIWVAFIPLPGGYLTMAFLSIGLSTRIFSKQVWNTKKIGITITHCGVLTLLVGGLITASSDQEGSITLRPQQQKSVYTDYFDYELLISNGSRQWRFSKSQLATSKQLQQQPWPFTLRIHQQFDNIDLRQRNNDEDVQEWHGMGKIFELVKKANELDAENNRAGITFSLTSDLPNVNGRYSIFLDMPINQTITTTHNTWSITLRKQQYQLPFAVRLIEFVQDYYPGTNIARGFSSLVEIKDAGITLRAHISMNNPLRYQHYTLYQSAFIGGTTAASVLAVVANPGFFIPYIACLVIALGLLIHLALQVPSMLERTEQL